MQPIMSKPRVINLFFVTSFNFSPSFYRLLSTGCATALPMGVAPEAIAEFFGYRLKKIDKPVHIFPLAIFFDIIRPFCCSSLLTTQAPKSKTRCTVLLDRYFLIPFSLFFVRIFFFDTLILLYHLYLRNPEVYFGPCLSRGPLVCAYK
jgi:hypothetical protein